MNATTPPRDSSRSRAAPIDWLIAWVLAVASFAVFWPALGYPFLTYDDGDYVTKEPMVNQGLRSAAVVWALSHPHASNWHPLTTLTHTTMCELFELDPGAHHALNLIVHSLNAALCFFAFSQLTGRRWPSAFVAAVFAFHPLRVESVAWVSELKDLLCGCFWFLALLAYARFAQCRTRGNHLLLAGATLLALLAKPMAVTLPATLLLLDYWPLRRWPAQPWLALVREKAWLFLLVGAHSVVTALVQLGTGAGDFAVRVPFAGRVGNAVVSYLHYIGKFFWPVDLAALYPHPIWWPWSDILVATAVLAVLGALAWRCARQAPWVLMGWLWFLGTLVPAIGLIQVGAQAMACRYTYIPSLGLTIAVTWSVAAVQARVRHEIWIGAASACAVLVALAVACRAALVPWGDSVTLFQHAMRTAEHPSRIHYWLGIALFQAKRPDEAVEQLRALLREDPGFTNNYIMLASILAQSKHPEEATAILRQATLQDTDSFKPWNNLGIQLTTEGNLKEAQIALERAERLAPDSASVQSNLGMFSLRTGQTARAETHFRKALRLNPWEPGYYNDLAVHLGRQGSWLEARELLAKAVWINPRNPNVLQNYATALDHFGEKAAAEKYRAEFARWKSNPSP